MKFNKLLLASLMTLAVAGVSACGDDNLREEQHEEAKATSIVISQSFKKDYYVNEDLDVTNLKVTALMSDNTERDVTADSQIDTTNFNKAQAGTYEIVVTYLEFTETVYVRVLEAEIVSVEFTLKKTEFVTGTPVTNDDFTAIATLEDGSKKDITLKTAITCEMYETGIQNLNLKYGDFEYNTDVNYTSSLAAGLEFVHANLNVQECVKNGILSVNVKEEKTINNATISNTCEVRGRTKTWTNPLNESEKKTWTESIKMGANKAQISFDMSSLKDGQKGIITLYVQNGSSSAASQYLKLLKPGVTSIDQGETIEFAGSAPLGNYGGGSPVVKLEVEVTTPGVYTFARETGTIDVFEADTLLIAPESTLSGFEIANAGTVSYIEGQTYSTKGLMINEVYSNGKRKIIMLNNQDLVINSSSFNSATPGKYNVSVKYKSFEEKIIECNVAEVKELELGFDQTYSSKNSYNSIYVNGKVRRIYDLNEDLDTNYLTVIANGEFIDNKTQSFILNKNEFEMTNNFDKTKAGKYTIDLAYKKSAVTARKSFTVNVLDINSSNISIVNGVVQTKVDPYYTGEIGKIQNGYNMFNTAQEALEFLEIAYNKGLISKTQEKVVELKKGTYNEKLEVNTPYVTLKSTNEDATKTLIEWDSLYGIPDISGYSQVTDSCYTLAVRETAVGFKMENITVSNYWNTQKRFDDAFGEKYTEHRALAMICQADKVVIDNCRLLGYQDTVQFMTGRQYVVNTFISGYTDFIFGTNNTTVFKSCTINVIKTEKSDGYITAFKGCNKGASDYVKYGAIFDACKFIAEDGVQAGSMALGRPWGAYSNVTIINSELGAHISKEPSSGLSSGERYVSMGGVNPYDETVSYKEYGNYGEGSISESQKGVTYLKAAEVANYKNLDVIFGKGKNGEVAYSDSWNPTK